MTYKRMTQNYNIFVNMCIFRFRDSVAFQPFTVDEVEGAAKIPLSARIRETILRDELNL